MTLSLCLGCDGGGSEDVTSAGTMGSGTTGPSAGPSTTPSPGTTVDPPGDTTVDPPGTTSTGPGEESSEGSSSTSSGGGELGDWLLTVDRGSNPPRLVRIDLTGAAVEVCSLAAVADYASIVFTRDGTLYGLNAAQNRIDVINPCNCSFQILGPTSLGPMALSLAASDDELLGIEPALDALVRVDLESGLGTVVGALGFMYGESGLAWSEPLALPYAIEGENDYLYTVDPVTGLSTAAHMLSVDITNPGLAVHPNDGVLYACEGDALYTIDTSNGLMTMVGGALGLTGGCQTLTPPRTAVACIDSL